MIVGITGSIAMGKSVVTNYLIRLGYEVIDSDLLVKQELDNIETIKQIVDYFGSIILFDDKINRKVLGKIIFEDEVKRKALNRIIHPKVINKIIQLTKNHQGLIFVDIPLLYEANLEYLVDKVVVVYTDYDKQINRLVIRDQINEEYARLKIASQIDIEIKKSKADFIINNNYSIENTYLQIDEIIKRLKNEI